MVVDLDVVEEGKGQIVIPVADFYTRCRPLLLETLAPTARLAEGTQIDALYVTGGGSELPLVSRMLREEFGRKVKRSEYTRSATAIGLAIQADAASGYTLREVFTRNFGVWRESDAGHRMVFDPIFPHGTRLPAGGEPPLTVCRQYRPVHNLGDFRYLEAGLVDEDGQPSGDITVWDEILFPFDPALADVHALEGIAVEHFPAASDQTHRRALRLRRGRRRHRGHSQSDVALRPRIPPGSLERKDRRGAALGAQAHPQSRRLRCISSTSSASEPATSSNWRSRRCWCL